MVNTPNFDIPLISASQAQKHVTHNEALVILDALTQIKVLDRDLLTPPGSPANGDTYIVASGTATGAWVGQSGKLAYYNVNAWIFYTLRAGMLLYIVDEAAVFVSTGSSLVSVGSVVQNAALVGVNTTADATNKLAVRSNSALFSALYVADSGNGDFQYKLNKEAAGDTASTLYQTNFSGVAEIGTLGDNSWSVKVSTDNFSTSKEAIKVNNTTGQARILRLATTPATTLTIASGVITMTQTAHKVDTQAAAASDDLDTISGGVEGDIIILEPANDARTVVITVAGNIKTSTGASKSLDNYGDSFMARFDGTNWIQIGGI